MIRVQDEERAGPRAPARDFHRATHGIGWAATAVVLAVTMVIAFVAPI